MTRPYYRPIHHEVEVFQHAYRNQLALMLKGPTGCGKSRFVEAMAADVGRPLCTVACHDDTSATDLLGRYLVEGGDTVWQDGPLTRAVREGAILYLDEVTEARDDIVFALVDRSPTADLCGSPQRNAYRPARVPARDQLQPRLLAELQRIKTVNTAAGQSYP
jgi:hypothetical protein